MPFSSDPSANLRPEYRPEIDGLRALAVVLVLFFHAGFAWMPGGYVGVDVFLVISGYLITRLLLFENASGTFSFKRFYLRRARRLAPALITTVLGCYLAGLVLMSPVDLEKLAQEMVQAILGVSNFYFSGKLDYFDTASSLRPLLHTWSLAVEEQYYLLSPLILMLVYTRFGFRGVLIASTVLAIFSLAAAEVMIQENPKVAYFWTPFRIWEFVVGGAMLWLPLRLVPRGFAGDVATLAGIGLVLFSAMTFDENTGIPGISALIPCLGAALILAARESKLASLLLSNPASRGLGLISYSLYLVHWPVIVFFSFARLSKELEATDRWPALILSVAIAAIMYGAVERPFRRSNADTNRRFVLATVSMVFATCATAGLTMLWKGIPERIVHPVAFAQSPYGSCRDSARCEIGASSTSDNPELLVIGDSNARHWAEAIDNWGKERGVSVLLLSSPSCNVTGSFELATDLEPSCQTTKEEIQRQLNANPAIPVVLAELWLGYGEDNVILQRLAEFAIKNRDHSFLVMGQIPYPKAPLYQCGTLHWFLMPAEQCRRYETPSASQTMNGRLTKAVNVLENARLFDPMKVLCKNAECLSSLDDGATFVDRNHLSAQGANFLLENGLSDALDVVLSPQSKM